MDEGLTIVEVDVKDVRFPTSLHGDGSDAMHADPDYSCAYTVIVTEKGLKGYGLTFTLGRGTEVVVEAVRAMSRTVLHRNAGTVFRDFRSFWRALTSDSQIRWLGPEKGVVHLATASIVNALWDLWARLEGKPLWKLLCDMEPETLVSTIDFRYIEDAITPDECVAMLQASRTRRTQREREIASGGYPAYTTQVGWIGYSPEKVSGLCREYLSRGFTAFKVKVGSSPEEDKKRCELVRKEVGEDNLLMMDANQKWNVDEAIVRMKELAPFRPYWIEEPTSPDDVLGHARISEELGPLGIRVATGEMCANRVMFKQFLQSGALQVCQIDSARIGGVNEILSVYFMAKKFNVAVCPHAGGVGLCEMVRHLQFFDYVCLSESTEGRYIEYVEQQHEHFEDPAEVRGAVYLAPKEPGYSTKLKESALEEYEYPRGREWGRLFGAGLFSRN
ncbi:UNVERIFIED_CONTAM: hypothetical protein PYX00_005111 [Menopon gallinae]|uniref:Mitochondrial enolase superfamily member 1 n=1 Tax=Menopon gallinae TaxID=328185 RepID=A0AAW2HQS9_9NEOP